MKLSDITNQLLKKIKSGEPDEGTPLEDINDAQDQPQDERRLVEYVRSKVDQCRQTNSRIAIEGIYLTNVAYLMGFDGVYYDTTYRQFKNIDPRRKLTRNRFKVNKILPTIQNRLARLTQSPPRYDVRPNSNSTEDKDCARLGLEIIEDVFEKQRFNEKRQDLLMAAMQGGHSYIQSLWDPTLGKPMVDPDTGKMSGYEGDVRLEVLNCLELFPDPLAKTLEEATFLIKAKVRKLDYFKSRYPGRGHLVKEEDSWLLAMTYDMKSNALTSVGVAGASTTDQMKNSAIELVLYEKRSEDYTNGRMIVIANGILLEDKELPIGEYDIVKFDDMIIGSRYNPEAIITHLRPIQDQYNVQRTKMADWVRKLLAGKYLAAKGHGLMQEAINNDNGEVVEFNPVPNAPAPTVMNIPQIPSYAYKEIETMDHEFDFVSGINEISRGVLPSASIPAQGMAFLQEQDQTRIAVQTLRNEIGYAKVGAAILKYVGKYYEMPRILKVAGDGLEYTVKDFVGADLNDNYDVIVIEGSTIPQSKVLKRQDIQNSMSMGLLGNPMDPQVQAKVLDMMEYGYTTDMWKKISLDNAQVKRVINAIEEGDMKTLQDNMSEFDNQKFHLEKMNEYRLTDKFQDLDDQKKGLFLWVMEWRIQAGIQQQNPGIMAQKNIAEATLAQNHGIQPPGSTDASGSQQAPPMDQEPIANANHLPKIQRGRTQ